MSEYFNEKYSDSLAIEYDPVTLGSLKSAFEYHGLHPDGDDPYYAAASMAMREALEKDNIASDYQTIIDIRRDKRETVQYLVNLTLRALNYVAEDNPEFPEYPNGYDKPSSWEKLISKCFTWYDDDRSSSLNAYEMFEYYLVSGEIQSNVHQRGVVLQWVRALYSERFQQEVRIADVGCSMNHVTKSLIMPDYFFSDVEVYDEDHSLNRTLTSTFNKLKNIRLPLGKCTGFDRENMLANSTSSDGRIRWDTRAMKWVKANSLRPAELLRPDLVEKYDLLDYVNPENIRFVNADFSQDFELGYHKDEIQEEYDIVYFSTVLYQSQNSPDVVLDMLSNGEKILSPDGLIIVSDFAYTEPDNKVVLKFFKNWDPWTYRTHIFDPHYPEKGFQEIAKWYNGRCGKVMLNTEIDSV